ncbi:MAG TPA: LPS assembly lipoprotein LptE [Methylomirabilota bacterium]|nr:LPS assembly lipoprotein LptE [Methylomirabilota bacterium]
MSLAFAIAGCQIRPLYAGGGSAASGTPSAIAELGRIAVEVQRDRIAQEMMNQLIFALRGGAALDDPAYTLRLIVAARKSELGIQVREEVPTANLITLTTTFTLTENVTGRVVTSDTIYTTASYDFSSQRFANLRAERDAENRAAKAAAEDIRTRLAIVLAEPAG